MKVDVQDISPCKKTLRIEIPKEDVDVEIEKAYDEVRTTALVPGFRKGRAPKNILKMRFNEYVKAEAIEKLVPPAFDKAIEEADLEVLRPLKPEDVKPPIEEIKIIEGEPIIFEVTVDVKPEIKLPEFNSLEIDKSEVNMTQENVDRHLNEIRQERASFIPIEDKPSEKGNYVTLTVLAMSEGEVLIEEKEKVIEIGDDIPIPELIEHLVGMKTGEEKDFSIKFPEDYKAKEDSDWEDITLAGKEVNFHVILHKITEKILPELNDDFAKDLGEESLAHLNAKVWNDLIEFSKIVQRAFQENELMEQLLEKSQFEVPEFVIEDAMNSIIRREQLEAKSRREPVDENISEERKQEYQTRALHEIREIWILNEVSDIEDVDVSEEELDERISAMAARVNREPQKYKKLLEDAKRIDEIKVSIWREKIFGVLIDKASQKRKLIIS